RHAARGIRRLLAGESETRWFSRRALRVNLNTQMAVPVPMGPRPSDVCRGSWRDHAIPPMALVEAHAMRRIALLIGGVVMALGLAPGASAADRPEAQKYRVYVGTYTNGGPSRGIYLMELDVASGKLSPPQLVGESVNPSF